MNPKLFFGLGCLMIVGCGALGDSDDDIGRGQGIRTQSVAASSAPIGLSLLFRNGVAEDETLVGLAPRYLQEIDIVESVPSTVDDGIDPLISAGRLSGLNWTNVALVEELWIPSLDGTFTRERYYRGARWMEQQSVFTVEALGPNGTVLGEPWVVRAGRDDRQTPADDTFIRRFDARQLALGCASVGDCAGATFVAEALIQARGALQPVQDARTVPVRSQQLRLNWNRLPGTAYTLAVDRIPASEAAFGPGFQVVLEPSSAPQNGSYYEPGESVSLRVSFLDGSGQRLHPVGELPSYGAYVAGQVESGLRYLDLTLQTRLYYALKHRESNLLVVLSGPTDQLRTPQTVVDPNAFFGPQVPFATTAVDGFTAVGQTVPPAAIIFGGLSDPSLWALPVSDLITFTIPEDAEAGTYVAAIKARRDYAGEALNRGATVEIAVGQATPTSFTAATTCNGCHSDAQTSFARLLHGIDDRRACFGCHASLGVEFDNALDIRVHTIHDRSNRFDADIHDCGLCHLTPPSGPQRGVLP
jgi:predicted CXXCH cytochrome family protein